MKRARAAENSGRLLLPVMVALLVIAWAGVVANASEFTLPKIVMQNTTEFAKAWGPATIARSDPGGSSMDFTFTGLTGDGTAISDNFEVLNAYGQDGGYHNADFSNFTGYSAKVENLDDAAVWVILYINTGFSSGDWHKDTFWQMPSWQYVGPGETAVVTMDFDNVQAYNISDNPVPHTGGGLGWPDGGIYAINAYDRTQVVNIGVQVCDFSKGSNPNATVRFSPLVTVTLESTTTLMKCSDNITYHVMVDDVALDLMGANYKINYDYTKLSFVSAVVGDLLNLSLIHI